MPFIHVKSLPLNDSFVMRVVVEGLTMDFTKGTGISKDHVTATWEFISPGHYAVGGKAASQQLLNSHPVLVDLLAPDFNSNENLAKMFTTIASSISKRINIPIENIFINHRQAHSGMVFDGGEVVRW